MKESTRIWSRAICSTCLTLAVVFCGSTNLHGQQTRPKTDSALDDLHQIGMKIQEAALKKDITAVLQYEPANLRAEHAISLRDKTSDIYCFLVDSHSSCTQGFGSWPPSVFEHFAGARQPGIAIIGADKLEPDGSRYGVLLFYDRSGISERSIRSPRYICATANFHKYVSWTFKLVQGKWESVGELFNYQSDARADDK